MSSKIIEKIVEEFEKAGFKVHRRRAISGISGITYSFEVLIESPRTGKKIAITYIDEVGFKDILSISASRIDTGIGHVLLARDANPRAVELLTRMGINVYIVGSRKELTTVIMRGEATDNDIKLIVSRLRSVLEG